MQASRPGAGRKSTEWNDPCNWNGYKVPTPNKDVIIASAAL